MLNLKKINSIAYQIGISAIVWIGLAILVGMNSLSHIHTSQLIDTISSSLDILIVFLSIIIYKKCEAQDKKIIIWFILGYSALIVNDITFYLLVFVKSIPMVDMPFLGFLTYYVPFLFWLVAATIFLSRILIEAVLDWKLFLKLVCIFIIFDFIIISLFFLSLSHNLSVPSRSTVSQVFTSTYKLIFFDLTILCLICVEEIGIMLLLVGIAIITAADFLFNYASIAKIDSLLSYGELFWFLGGLFVYYGIIVINNNKYLNFKESFRQTNAIKSRLIFWTFGIATASFLIFFIVSYIFSLISNVVFSGLPFFITTYSVVVVMLSLFMGKYFETPFKKIAANIESVILNKNTDKIDNKFSIAEFIYLEKFIINTFKINQEKDRITRQLGEVAAQVAHDIRSPLTALNVCLQHIPEIPERQRITLRNAANRINDIANNLLSKYKNNSDYYSVFESDIGIWLLEPVIESIVSEKRLQYENDNIEIDVNIKKNAYFLFSKFDLNQLKRILSNLINNAAESYQTLSGKILINLDTDGVNVILEVKDHGCGIAADKLVTIFENKQSTKPTGLGMGLAHAKSVLKSMNGEIDIISRIDFGTTVVIKMPVMPPPAWFIAEIILKPDMLVIVLDDDESIHGAWDARINDISKSINVLHFKTGNDFISWQINNKNLNILVLSDYELLGELKSGLDILEELSIGDKGVLITSHYEKSDIIRRCLTADIKLLPKNLVTHIPIRLESLNNIPQKFLENRCDYILIENDSLITEMWLLHAEFRGKKLVVFDSIQAAEKKIYEYDRTIPIYIDSDLGDNEKGEDYAKRLYECGFSNIYLATGYSAEQFNPMYWIKGIVGKDTPF
jgi:signal transduction histidine kinase